MSILIRDLAKREQRVISGTRMVIPYASVASNLAGRIASPCPFFRGLPQ